MSAKNVQVRVLKILPTTFDDFSINRWYLYIAGYLLVILVDFTFIHRVIVNPALHGVVQYYPSYSQSFQWNMILTDIAQNWFVWLCLSAIPLNGLLFSRWYKTIPATLERLITRHLRLKQPHSPGSTLITSDEIVHHYQKMLQSPKRFFVIIGILLAPLGIVVQWIITQDSFTAKAWLELSSHQSGLGRYLGGAIDFVAIIDRNPGNAIYIAVLAYFVGVALWVFFATTQVIDTLTEQLELIILPNHPDKCGGLRFLGMFFLQMNLPFLALAFVIGMIDILERTFNEPFWVGSANIALFGVILPILFVTFFIPLWRIHNAMVARKYWYQDLYAERLSTLEEQINEAFQQGTVLEAQKAKEEIDIIRVVYVDAEQFPTWPFNRTIFLSFLLPQVFSILGALQAILQLGQEQQWWH